MTSQSPTRRSVARCVGLAAVFLIGCRAPDSARSTFGAQARLPTPDLSERPFHLTVERTIPAPPAALYEAWTKDFDRWFAASGTLLMKAKVDALFFFEAHYEGQRHPHYGRFLRLEDARLIEFTWMNQSGTKGAETVVTVELLPCAGGTRVKLTHAGLPDEQSRSGHEKGWQLALANLERVVVQEGRAG